MATKGPDVIVAPPEETVLVVSKLMAEADVGSVIIRKEGDIKGIFTERDLLRRVVARQKPPDSTPVAEVMSAPVKHCGLHDDLDRCAERLASGHIRHLAVVEDGALVGLIGLRDIMRARAR